MDAEQAFISMYGQMSRRHRAIFKKELSTIRKVCSGSVTDSVALAEKIAQFCKSVGSPLLDDEIRHVQEIIASALPSGKQQTHGAK